jgi:hypothetical protein
LASAHDAGCTTVTLNATGEGEPSAPKLLFDSLEPRDDVVARPADTLNVSLMLT